MVNEDLQKFSSLDIMIGKCLCANFDGYKTAIILLIHLHNAYWTRKTLAIIIFISETESLKNLFYN